MPLSIWGGRGSPKKQRFSKWPTSVSKEHAFFICGAILTNKRSILTNSDMGIQFLTFYSNIKHILDRGFKNAAGNNVIQKEI